MNKYTKLNEINFKHEPDLKGREVVCLILSCLMIVVYCAVMIIGEFYWVGFSLEKIG